MDDLLAASYSDNHRQSVAARLGAEIEADPSRLWVCSGYFAVSAWQVLSEALNKVEDFRLLLGKDYQYGNVDPSQEELRLAELVRQAIRRETEPNRLISRADADQVAELVEFLERHQSGEPAVKLWEGQGFLHAKAYLLSQSVGIGSANFTYNGMTSNRELVGWRQDRQAVAEVTDWFTGYWEDPNATDYTEELIAALRDSPLLSDEYTPFEVLIKTLAARYGLDDPPELEGAEFTLKWFQEQAVQRLVRLLNGPAGAALLADAVGLGKTFMALGVIHHYVYEARLHRRGRGRPVLIVAPASLESMWQEVLVDHQLEWACEFVTTQSLRGDFDPEPYAGAELVVIDEAHRLRGRGQWFQSIMRLLHRGPTDDRRVLLLSATPVNTSMDDLVALLDVATRERRQVWAPAIADYAQHLRTVERHGADPFPLLDRFVVRRSRSDVLRAQEVARAAGERYGEELRLPDRVPTHAAYDYGAAQSDLFDEFATTLRRLSLAPYDLERYRRDEAGAEKAAEARADYDRSIAALGLAATDARTDTSGDVPTRPGTIAALYAAGLLTRFQSSLRAIHRSLLRLQAVLGRTLQGIDQQPPRLPDLSAREVRRLLATEIDVDVDSEEEAVRLDEQWEVAFTWAPQVDPTDYDLDGVSKALTSDLARIERLLELLPAEADDGKVDALLEALQRSPDKGEPGAPGLAEMPLLIFSQFRDTADYLYERLQAAGVDCGLLHGGVVDQRRAELAEPFDPNKGPIDELRGRVLISTEVLAEGYNLQNAQAVVNFDLHFNPQVAVQRSGRVDRIGSPHDTVYLVSFTPPESLNAHIGLLTRLDDRFRRIHGLGLGDEPVTNLEGDAQHRTLEQMKQLYRADDPAVLDEAEETGLLRSTDGMRLVLDMFLRKAGREHIERIPYGVSSVRRHPADADVPPGAFLAFTEPDESQTHWRFYPSTSSGTWDAAVIDDLRAFRAINCAQEEQRVELVDPPPGPTCIDWELVATAAEELAAELNGARATAARRAGSETNQFRLLVQRKAAGSDFDVTPLVDRLEEVDLVRWRHEPQWQQVEQRLRRLDDIIDPQQRKLALANLVEEALELLGPPQEDAPDGEPAPISAEQLRLVAYERTI